MGRNLCVADSVAWHCDWWWGWERAQLPDTVMGWWGWEANSLKASFPKKRVVAQNLHARDTEKF